VGEVGLQEQGQAALSVSTQAKLKVQHCLMSTLHF
jgi:hypothetical protein